ncbi:MAG: DUF1223 domain-containing protein [Terriglobales bacterium]|jgi:hypothetical protein
MKTTRLTLTLFVRIAVLVTLLMNLSRFAVASDPPRSDAAAPVLVELFTSEGCSSCPPADALLEKLDGSQPIVGARVIVLSEHVDYWDHDGWKDAYSSSFFTARQNDYARRFGLNSPYTPQMVIDGAGQLNGSNAEAVAGAIESARGHFKIPVRISSVSLANPKTMRVHLEVEALPGEVKARKADILVAVALDHAASHVSAGENKGRDIRHVAVVESISKVGTVEKGKNFDRDVLVKIKSTSDPANLRLIAIVQESDAGEVVGAALVGAPIKMSLLVNVNVNVNAAVPGPTDTPAQGDGLR